MPPKPEKNYWAIKSAVGSLFKAVTLSTDPAQTLSFASSLINTTRAFLIQKLEEKVPDSVAIPYALNTILKVMIENYENGTITPEGIKIMDQRIDAIWKDTAMARYGLQIYRDILFCDALHARWKDANAIYVQSNAAWALSNSQLSDINKQLMEIIVRHDLMTFPKGEVFNMDEIGSSMGKIMKRVGAEAQQEG
jgi:hypothetical protein